MDRQEAERIYELGGEVVVETLLNMDARIREIERRMIELEQIIARLTRNSTNSSGRHPSIRKA